eukprot:CAMPEP_0119425594 /NCGR_PEP_ID=MMETSP1335-20130426/34754_1 /TAXON_ID=259385 /ORGANISM="Chrysoculter rhomboideus, Strain RCC1486" /LENGTH=109 /DNA_ID=CAMNT_0007451167 /DNA_START=208 /DNA_END=534 /DNA_ORIENTATION=+
MHIVVEREDVFAARRQLASKAWRNILVARVVPVHKVAQLADAKLCHIDAATSSCSLEREKRLTLQRSGYTRLGGRHPMEVVLAAPHSAAGCAHERRDACAQRRGVRRAR